MSIEVISKRSGGFKGNNNGIIHSICRPSPLGNPFTVQKYGHNVCIDMFEEYFDKAIVVDDEFREAFLEIVRDVDSGKSVLLQCWCAVANGSVPCHGDIIKRRVEEYIGRMAIGDHEQVEQHEGDVRAQAEHPDEIVREGIPWGNNVPLKDI